MDGPKPILTNRRTQIQSKISERNRPPKPSYHRAAGVSTSTHFREILPAVRRNTHPTVKPTDLMQYLCRLVTPTGGVILDPFTGSGSTGKAARLEGFDFVGIEREPEYADIARARIQAARTPTDDTLFA